jgi:hypothetical protein
MNRTPYHDPDLPRDLGGGLLLRQAVPADAEAMAELNSNTLVDPNAVPPDEGEANWTLDMMSGRHPTTGPADFTVVEEVATGRLVAAMNLISQTWRYDGIPFAVGRPEQVVTRPEYRRRGLVRAQMSVIHRWSAARGELVQGITGIPGFYRQFGYEMALTLEGGRSASVANIPPPPASRAEPFRFRPATVADVGWIAEADAAAGARALVSPLRDEALWRYEIAGKRERNMTRLDLRVIETAEGAPAGRPTGRPVGFVGREWRLVGGQLGVLVAEVRPGVAWLPVAPALLRELWSAGETIAARDGGRMETLTFVLGPEHPLFRAVPLRLAHVDRPYGWYLRVPDVPGFLRHVAPALEARLAGSVATGYTGELKLSFYRNGAVLRFADGRLAAAEPWTPSHEDQGSAGFPGLSFLQLLFGYRSLAELRETYPDCWTESDEAHALLEALFPKRSSNVWPLS